jgi:hypothetical protein
VEELDWSVENAAQLAVEGHGSTNWNGHEAAVEHDTPEAGLGVFP